MAGYSKVRENRSAMCTCVCCRRLIGNTTGLQFNGWRRDPRTGFFSYQSERSNTRHLFLQAWKRGQLIKLIYHINRPTRFRVMSLFLRYGVAIVWSDTHSSHSSNGIDSHIKGRQSIRVKRSFLKDIITQNGTKPEISPNNRDGKSLLLLLVIDPES